MKTRESKMAYGQTMARRVLECGGKRSATLLSLIGRSVFDVGCWMFSPFPKAACALARWNKHSAPAGRWQPPYSTGRSPHPPQSKTWRQWPIYFCFLFSAFSFPAWGQSYSIDWYKIAGGGGTSTNGQYAVSGTIGQPDAGGTMSGGNYSLTGGFWSLISVVQTTGAPTLNISDSGNTVTVYWQNVSGWSLQQNNNLSLPANWSASGGISNDGTNNFITLTSPTGNLFFRLAQ